jgi:peptidyl-prolyl isomerase D
VTKRQKVIDSTGGPHEDFPNSHVGQLYEQDYARTATELKEIGNKAFKAGDLRWRVRSMKKR